jgi:predicted nucleic acid-binding Zn ribbon protein
LHSTVSDQRLWQAGQTDRSNERTRSAAPSSDGDARDLTSARLAADIAEVAPVCCTGHCREGRDCPLRPRRARIAQVWLISALLVLLLVLLVLTR